MSNRDKLIDELEEYYQDDYEYVEEEIKQYLGVDLADVNIDDMANENEGFWAYFSTSDLASLLEVLQNNDTVAEEYTLRLTPAEVSLLRDAMEAYADPAFSRSSNDSKIARWILKKLNNI